MTGLKALPGMPAVPRYEPRPHHAVAAALAALLHLTLLWVFLQTMRAPPPPPPVIVHVEPITLWLTLPKASPAPPAPAPVEKPDKKHSLRKPDLPVPNAHGVPAPPPAPAAPQPGEDYNGLRALGRYLTNCSGMNYGALSGRDRAHCLENLWDLPPVDDLTRLRLGSEPQSVWKAQRDKRNAPAPNFTEPCADGSRNSNLGLPCVDLLH